MEESTLALAQSLAKQTIHEESPPGSPRATRSHASILAEKVQGFRWHMAHKAISGVGAALVGPQPTCQRGQTLERWASFQQEDAEGGGDVGSGGGGKEAPTEGT